MGFSAEQHWDWVDLVAIFAEAVDGATPLTMLLVTPGHARTRGLGTFIAWP